MSSSSLIIYFSRADENYAVGYIEKGNTEYIAEFVKELTGAGNGNGFERLGLFRQNCQGRLHPRRLRTCKYAS